jgi:hypothetical protein
MEILTDWNFWGNLGWTSGRELHTSSIWKKRLGGAATVLTDKKTIEAKDSLIVNFEDPRFPVN